MELGERIRQARQRARLSQEKVAELVGVSRQAVTKWESGQSAPTTENLLRLAEVLGTTVDSLIAPEDASRTVAEEVWRMLRAEEAQKAVVKKDRTRKNIRTALVVALIFAIVYLAGKLLCWDPTEMALFPWILDTSSLRHSYLFGWLLHNGLFFYVFLAALVLALCGKRRLSLATAFAFVLGLLWGEGLGSFPRFVGPGYHYGWLIWGGIQLASLPMGIWLQRMKAVSLREKKLRLWGVLYLLIPPAITFLVLLGVPAYARP